MALIPIEQYMYEPQSAAENSVSAASCAEPPSSIPAIWKPTSEKIEIWWTIDKTKYLQ